MDFLTSQTFSNLQTAYQDELIASSQYRLYAKRAEEEGKRSVSARFSRMADRALSHAEICLKMGNRGKLPTTLENLRSAAKCEFGEWTHKYATYAQIAKAEGFADQAARFDRLADISRYHNVCVCGLADALEQERLFLREEDTVWICLACGYVHTHACAPQKCPVCGKPQGWFEDLQETE